MPPLSPKLRVALAVLATVLTALAGAGLTLIIDPGPDPAPGARTITVHVGAEKTPVAVAAGSAGAVRAAVRAANSTPAICSPAQGAGELGVCAPKVQLLGGARAAGVSASIARGRPIGVDVSSYQGCSIDWRRSRAAFAFFKATEGTGYTDRCLYHNVASAKAAHLPYGVYDFLRAGRSSASAEAQHFIAAVRAAGANTSLPPVADVEVNQGLSRSAINAYVCRWHRTVAAALHRRVTLTYTGNWFWAPQLAANSCGTKLWVSAYTFAPILPRPWRSYTFWQFSDGLYGPPPRLVAGWDHNVFNGSFAELGQLAAGVHRPNTHATRVWCRKLRAWRHKGPAQGRALGTQEHRAAQAARAPSRRLQLSVGARA
jgi:lysozyme